MQVNSFQRISFLIPTQLKMTSLHISIIQVTKLFYIHLTRLKSNISVSRFLKRWHFLQQMESAMRFNNQINRSGGAGYWRKQKKKQCQQQVYMLLINCSKKAFCSKTHSDLFPEKTLLPPSVGKKKSSSLVTVFLSECVGFINGKHVIRGGEMLLRSPMWTSGSVDSFMVTQLYLPPLSDGGIRGSARDHWLTASSQAFNVCFQMTFRSRICIWGD